MSLIVPAALTDLPEVLALLERNGLPQAGLADVLATTVIAREDERVIGCAALEVYGTVALLRSVAVDPAHRSQGLGSALVQRMFAHARALGVCEVFLLTETASTYFPRFGFRPIAREAVSPAIHQSVEWREACPVSAQAMVVRLEPAQPVSAETSHAGVTNGLERATRIIASASSARHRRGRSRRWRLPVLCPAGISGYR